jgi:hypothetical protein
MKPYHIVFTTIYEPDELLWSLFENLSTYQHLEETVCWIIGDRKTPGNVTDLSQTLSNIGLETHYLDIPAQEEWGRQFEPFYNTIPYDNETRRNLGYLHALAHGCQTLISMDDDNFPDEDDFIGGHTFTGTEWSGEEHCSSDGYYNICQHLQFDVTRKVFPRGYPFKLRQSVQRPTTEKNFNTGRIGVTAGLWLKDPDVDATTWLNGPIKALEFSGPDQTILANNTWTPINTQNTSVTRELIPAFFTIPMGCSVPGGRIERYGDIWGGYFLQAITQGTDYRISIGLPIVEHRRNPHCYLQDMRHEFWGMMLTDWLLDKLRGEFSPASLAILDRVYELSEFILQIDRHSLPQWCPSEIEDYFRTTGQTIKHWADACHLIQS